MTDFNANAETAPRRRSWLGAVALLLALLTAAWLSGVPEFLTGHDGPVSEYVGIPWDPTTALGVVAVMLVGLSLMSRRGPAVWLVKSVARGLRKLTYWRGILLLGRASSESCVKGVAVLENLARRHPGEYHVRVILRLCDFVQDQFPPKGGEYDERKKMLVLARAHPRACAPEVRAAARAVGMLRARLPSESKRGIEAGHRLDFTEVDITGANLKGGDFTGAKFGGANLIDTKLGGAVLADVDFERANLKLANLDRADLRRANLSIAYFEFAFLDGANLEGANLESAHLGMAQLGRANLENADASCALLEEASLSGGNLTNADFSRARMKGAYLIGTNLSGANLKGADLRGSVLSVANLDGADLDGAKLDDASLDAAKLEGATGLTQESLGVLRPTEAPASLPPGLFWPFEENGDGEWSAKHG